MGCMDFDHPECLWQARLAADKTSSSFEANGPMLSYRGTQKILYDAVGDVFVSLNCCNVALVSHGQKLEGKLEVLSVFAKGVLTPTPGKRRSFPSILIQQIQKILRQRQNLSVRTFHSQLHESKYITGFSS